MKNKSHVKTLHLILKNFHPPGNSVRSTLTTLLAKQHAAGVSGFFKGMGLGAPGVGHSGKNLKLSPRVARPGRPKAAKSAAGQKQFEMALDRMVASTLTNGQMTTGVLKNIFGLVPGLIGR